MRTCTLEKPRGHTQTLREVNLFLSGFRDICLLTFPTSSAVINQSTHISVWQNWKQDWKKQRRRKGKDVREGMFILLCCDWWAPLTNSTAQRTEQIKNTGTWIWCTNTSPVCLYKNTQYLHFVSVTLPSSNTIFFSPFNNKVKIKVQHIYEFKLIKGVSKSDFYHGSNFIFIYFFKQDRRVRIIILTV